jgi:hypothetical protein
MPIIYEYLGIKLKFWANEHYPIHVHAFYAGQYSMKVEFFLKANKITKTVYKTAKGYKRFPSSQMKDLKDLIEKYQYQIVEDWITFVIRNKKVSKRVIRKRIQ